MTSESYSSLEKQPTYSQNTPCLPFHKLSDHPTIRHLILLLILSTTIFHNALADIPSHTIKTDPRPLLSLAYTEFPPYTYTNSKGIPQGHLIELAKELANTIDYRLEAHSFPSRRTAQMLFAGKVDLFLSINTFSEHLDKVLISKTVIDHIQLRAYHLKKTPRLTKKEDLNGKKVVTLRGYNYGGWIDHITAPNNNIHHFIANNREQALRILVGRNADYLLDYKLTLPAVLSKNDFPPLAYNDFLKLSIHIIISAKTPNSDKLMRNLEEAFLTLGDRNPVLHKEKKAGYKPAFLKPFKIN